MTGHLRPVFTAPCHTCGTIVTVYRVWYGGIALRLCVTHDDAGLHRCSRGE